MAQPLFHVRRLSQDDYSREAIEIILNQIVQSGGTIVAFVPCSTIRAMAEPGSDAHYAHLDIIFTT